MKNTVVMKNEKKIRIRCIFSESVKSEPKHDEQSIISKVTKEKKYYQFQYLS